MAWLMISLALACALERTLAQKASSASSPRTWALLPSIWWMVISVGPAIPAFMTTRALPGRNAPAWGSGLDEDIAASPADGDLAFGLEPANGLDHVLLGGFHVR